MKVKNRVREYREAKGWIQADLVKATGLSKTGVSQIESGGFVPSLKTALLIAETLGCKVDELFYLEKSPGT